MGIITYNGKSSQDLSVVVEHPPEYEYPERDYEIIHVPGRNGDVVIEKKTYKNVNRKYEIAVGSYTPQYTQMVNKISEWLHSSSKYARLEDSYEPDYYRMAIYAEGNSIRNLYHIAGRTTINFNCKPQRFLKTGDTKSTFSAAGTLTNPTNFTALPIITVKGSGNGVLTVGSYTVTITGIQNGMILDSMIGDAYLNTTNLNNNIEIPKGFPELVPGSNNISFSGGITSVDVVPKWWTL